MRWSLFEVIKIVLQFIVIINSVVTSLNTGNELKLVGGGTHGALPSHWLPLY